MRCNYKDITSKLGRPKWYDESGCPRYCNFVPTKVSNIYAEEVALFEIACQACGDKFLMAESWDDRDWFREQTRGISARLKDKEYFGFGDPPCFFNKCASGCTMCSDTIRCVEFWQKDNLRNWKRNHELEIVYENESKEETSL